MWLPALPEQAVQLLVKIKNNLRHRGPEPSARPGPRDPAVWPEFPGRQDQPENKAPLVQPDQPVDWVGSVRAVEPEP